jgi:hypothetical protein
MKVFADLRRDLAISHFVGCFNGEYVSPEFVFLETLSQFALEDDAFDGFAHRIRFVATSTRLPRNRRSRNRTGSGMVVA